MAILAPCVLAFVVECGGIDSFVSIEVIFLAFPRTAVADVLVACIGEPVVGALALIVPGLMTLVGAACPGVGTIMAMLLVALVVSWIVTRGVVYN